MRYEAEIVICGAGTAGSVAAIAAAWIATSVDTAVFRKPFGVYLLLTGVMTLFQTKKSSK